MGKLEPISPVSPVHMDPDLDLVPARFSKEELIQNMDRVDREITMVEQQICKLRKKQVCAFMDMVIILRLHSLQATALSSLPAYLFDFKMHTFYSLEESCYKSLLHFTYMFSIALC